MKVTPLVIISIEHLELRRQKYKKQEQIPTNELVEVLSERILYVTY